MKIVAKIYTNDKLVSKKNVIMDERIQYGVLYENPTSMRAFRRIITRLTDSYSWTHAEYTIGNTSCVLYHNENKQTIARIL